MGSQGHARARWALTADFNAKPDNSAMDSGCGEAG